MSLWHMMTARQGSLVGLTLEALPLQCAMSVSCVHVTYLVSMSEIGSTEIALLVCV